MSDFAKSMTTRAEACLRDMGFTLSAARPLNQNGAYADRAQVLTNLRYIKARAIEAEILLRALDRRAIAVAARDAS